VISTTARPSFPLSPQTVTQDMIQLGPNSSGQRLFNGDSGGSCSHGDGSPYVIAGVNEEVDTTGNSYLVAPIVVQTWIEQNLHSPPSATDTPVSNPSFVSSASTITAKGRTDFIIAALKNPRTGQKALYMKAYSDGTGWSAWSALSTTGL